MYLDELIKILEIIKAKHGNMPSYLLNKEYDLFAEINRVYTEKVEDENVPLSSDEIQAAISFNVSNASGAPSTIEETALETL